MLRSPERYEFQTRKRFFNRAESTVLAIQGKVSKRFLRRDLNVLFGLTSWCFRGSAGVNSGIIIWDSMMIIGGSAPQVSLKNQVVHMCSQSSLLLPKSVCFALLILDSFLLLKLIGEFISGSWEYIFDPVGQTMNAYMTELGFPPRWEILCIVSVRRKLPAFGGNLVPPRIFQCVASQGTGMQG